MFESQDETWHDCSTSQGLWVPASRGRRNVNIETIHLKSALSREALALGFDCIGVTDPAAIGDAGKHFHAFIEAGGHGEMDWLAAHPERRADPRVLWPEVRSVIMLGVNYGPERIRWRSCSSATAARSPSTPRATTITT